jgi:hypothetical protein
VHPPGILPRRNPATPRTYTLSGSFAALWQGDAEDRDETTGVYPYEIALTLDDA